MNLVYIDDAGSSYEKEGLFFKDGPFIIYSSILVSEEKYFHIERLYTEIANEFLSISNWEDRELHAHQIWHEAEVGIRDKKKTIGYFEELFQFVTKLNLKIVFGICQKTKKETDKEIKEKETKKSIYAFLHALEYQLSEDSQNGILIADAGSDLLSRAVYDRTKWRYSPNSVTEPIFKSCFKFESQSCFIVDQLHSVDSNKSLLVQLADHISFVIQRVLTYEYLKQFAREGYPKASLEKVPISLATFAFLVKFVNPRFSMFDDEKDDVIIDRLDNYPAQVGDRFLRTDFIPMHCPQDRSDIEKIKK